MTDYAKLKLIDLKDLCAKRNLPTNGIKKDLIARLQGSDATASSGAATTGTNTPQRTVSATAHLPSAEEYEINWDEDDTSAATKGPAGEKVETKAVISRESGKDAAPRIGSGGGKTEKKQGWNEIGNPSTDNKGEKRSQRMKLTELFPDLPSVSKDKDDGRKLGQEKKQFIETKSTPKTGKTSENNKREDEKDTNSPEFKANLPATTVTTELEKRKARLARFGDENMDSSAKEAFKKLERAQRFGATESSSTKEVKGLDSALPERRKPSGKRGYEGPVGGRGGVNKRQRYNNIGSRGNNTNPQPSRRNGTSIQRQKVGGILDDPIEKEKAEKRKQRFGN